MRIGEAAKQVEVSVETLRNWDRRGLIKVDRSPLGQRVFTPEALQEIQQVIKSRSQQQRRKSQ